METPTSATPAVAATTPQAGNPTTPEPTPPAGGGNPQPETVESLKAKLLAAEGKLAESVTAEKNLRTKNKELEPLANEYKKIKDAELPEIERLKTQLAEKEKAANDATAKARELQIKVVAGGNGYQPDAAALWLSTQTLEDVSDEGIKTALAKAPDWVKAQAQPGVTTNANNPARQGGSTLTKEMIAKMSPQELVARMAEVDAVLAAG